MLLDRRDNLKLADFSGSCIEGSDFRALVIYDVRCRLSNVDEPDRASDLFALGCAMYEMATGHLPYHDLPSKHVQRNFFRKEFPSLDELKREAPCIAEAIDRCWHVRKPRGFKSAEEVVEVLAKEIRYTEKKTKVRHECQTEEQDSGQRKGAAKTSKSSNHKKRSRSVATSKSSRSSQSRTHDRKRRRHRDRSVDKTIDQHRSKEEYRNSEGKTNRETDKPSLLHKFFNSMKLRN
ncbi:hypothetical protein PG985_011006 [Apiospora marii]|uniref:Protein kinase domain-containing protein n=1 Tax=Apiospora marii TaxID=335849 RepID=A0ABR1SSF8_9PEZI